MITDPLLQSSLPLWLFRHFPQVPSSSWLYVNGVVRCSAETRCYLVSMFSRILHLFSKSVFNHEHYRWSQVGNPAFPGGPLSKDRAINVLSDVWCICRAQSCWLHHTWRWCHAVQCSTATSVHCLGLRPGVAFHMSATEMILENMITGLRESRSHHRSSYK